MLTYFYTLTTRVDSVAPREGATNLSGTKSAMHERYLAYNEQGGQHRSSKPKA